MTAEEQLVEVMARAHAETTGNPWDRPDNDPVGPRAWGRWKDAVRDEQRAVLAALRQAEEAAGWQCVPQQLDSQMRYETHRRIDRDASADIWWREVLAAAPRSPGSADEAPTPDTLTAGTNNKGAAT